VASRTARTLLVTVPVALVAAAGGLGYIAAQATPGNYRTAQEQYGTAPTWTLTDQNGKTVSSSQLLGKVQVVTYLFPYCTSYCPAVTHVLASLEADLKGAGLAGNRVQMVAFNVDPEDTGPADMRAFLKEYGVSPTDPSWTYVTGTQQQIETAVTGGYHVYYEKETVEQENQQIAQQQKLGQYVPEPKVANPLQAKAKPDFDIVHNDQIDVVAPNGTIFTVFAEGASVSETDLYEAVQHAILDQ
jgi:cytochrome oxidase Cu insertion factor (SCO1/SenC/PrrC family)